MARYTTEEGERKGREKERRGKEDSENRKAPPIDGTRIDARYCSFIQVEICGDLKRVPSPSIWDWRCKEP